MRGYSITKISAIISLLSCLSFNQVRAQEEEILIRVNIKVKAGSNLIGKNVQYVFEKNDERYRDLNIKPEINQAGTYSYTLHDLRMSPVPLEDEVFVLLNIEGVDAYLADIEMVFDGKSTQNKIKIKTNSDIQKFKQYFSKCFVSCQTDQKQPKMVCVDLIADKSTKGLPGIQMNCNAPELWGHQVQLDAEYTNLLIRHDADTAKINDSHT